MKYDTCLTLSELVRLNGRLSQQTKGRVKKAIEFYRNGAAPTITMSGGPVNRSRITKAGAMAKYAFGQGIPHQIIYTEEQSLDTVGQAIFSKRNVAIPQDWESLIVVSHDYHMARVKKIFSFVYGREYDLQFEAVNSRLLPMARLIKHEKESLEAFARTFKGVKQGNDYDILSALVERHPLYKGLKGKTNI